MPADADAFLGQREIPHPAIAVIDDELAHNFLQNHSIRRSYQRRPRANDASARASTTETLSLPPAALASSTSRCAAVSRLAAYLWSVKPMVSSRSEEHTSELQSLMRISYAVFCLKKKKQPASYINDTLLNK